MLSCVLLFATPWTVAHQTPLSMGFSRQEYWSGLPCPPPGDLPYPGIKPASLMSPTLAGTSLPLVPPGTLSIRNMKRYGEAVLRWQRNRMGRPLSHPQIHQKNISMPSKFYKTTSECWQRTSGTQKSRLLSSKTGRKKYIRQKNRQRR